MKRCKHQHSGEGSSEYNSGQGNMYPVPACVRFLCWGTGRDENEQRQNWFLKVGSQSDQNGHTHVISTTFAFKNLVNLQRQEIPLRYTALVQHPIRADVNKYCIMDRQSGTLNTFAWKVCGIEQ